MLQLQAGGPAVRAIQRQMGTPGVVQPRAQPVSGASTSRSEITMLRLHAGSPAARAVQRHMAMPGVVRPRAQLVTGANISRSETTMLRLHAGGPTARAVQRQGAMSRAILTRTQSVARTRTNRSETTPLQPQKGATPERTVQRQVGSPELGTSSTSPVSLSAPAEGPATAGGGGQPLPGLQAAQRTTSRMGDVGTTILHRYRAGSVEQANQGPSAPPGPALPEIRVSRQSLAPGMAGLIMPHRFAPAVHNASQGVLAATAGPAGLIMPHRFAPAVRNADQGMLAATASPGRVSETQAASGAVTGAGMALLAGTVQRASETSILRQLDTPPSRSTPPMVGVPGRTLGPGREAGAFSPDMPLLQRVGGEAVGAEVEGSGQVASRRPIPGAPSDLVLQRAAADFSVGRQPEPPGPGPSPPGDEPAAPGPEGPDLERLADEVMAIIEWRLTIQRESMGL
jgi:hypothetical protein